MGNEMENTETKMDSTLKKMAKVLRMTNGNYEKNRFYFPCIFIY